jgi:hypothetical protein
LRPWLQSRNERTVLRPLSLYRTNIPPEIIGLIPESVARDNAAVPVAWASGLVVAMAERDDEVLEKLRFILNTPITVVLATPQAIEFAVQRYYPQP